MSYQYLVIIYLLFGVSHIYCQAQSYKKDRNGLDFTVQEFNETDTSGVFTGVVTGWNEESWERALEGHALQVYLTVSDKSGNTVRFMVLTPACLQKTKNVQVDRLIPGSFVRVRYRMEEAIENGVVNSRAYYARCLEYP